MTKNKIQKNIPNGWSSLRLGNLFDFKNGLNKGGEFFGKGTPIVNYMDVYRNTRLYKEDILGTVTLSGNEVINNNVKKGDVFFTRTSETLKEIGMTSVLLDDLEGGVFSGYVLRARPTTKKLVPEYCAYSMRTFRIRKEIMRKSSMTTRALTNGRFLSQVEYLLPPIEEQKQIVKILEIWDKYLEKLSNKINIKRDIKKGLMQNLLTGKIRLAEFSDEWKKVKLEDIAKIKKGTQLNREHMIKNSKYPVINGGISPSGFTDTWNMKKNTITISEGGNSCGYVNYIKQDFWCGGHCYILEIKNTDINFLYQNLKLLERKIMSLRVGSGLPNIQKKALENLKINIPKIKEQTAIAKILTTADQEIEALEKKKKNIEYQKKFLLNNLVTGKIRVPEFVK